MASLSGKAGELMITIEKVAIRIMNANLKRSLRVVLGIHRLKRLIDREIEVDVSRRVVAERMAATKVERNPAGTHLGTESGGPET